MPKISIIVTTYNIQDYVENALQSLIKQSLQNIEIICVDDCSSDNTVNVIKKYLQKDNRITLVALNENKGVSNARNIGINKAKGEYIAFVDGDDWVDLDFYEKLYLNAIENDADVSKGRLVKLGLDFDFKSNLNKRIRKNKYAFNGEFTTAIYRNEFLKNNKIVHPVEIKTYEDVAFSIHVLLLSKKTVFDDSANYYYFQHEGSKVRTFNENVIEALLRCCVYTLNLMNNNNLKKKDYSFLLWNTIIEKIIFSRLYRCGLTIEESEKVALKIIKQIIPYIKYDYKVLNNCDFNGIYKHIYPNNYTFLEHIFSIKNDVQKRNKVVSILGFKFRIKRK